MITISPTFHQHKSLSRYRKRKRQKALFYGLIMLIMAFALI